MPQVGFEPTIPVFERAKTVRALDRWPLWSAENLFHLSEMELLVFGLQQIAYTDWAIR
jgi:hypothetical protein